MEPSPTIVGRYEIRRELGRGMMGVVYEAFDPGLDRTVALKIIHPSFAPGPAERKAFEDRFVAEARIAAGLSHPGIVVVHDVGRDQASGLFFIAFECLPGETLASRMAKGARPPWAESLEIVRRVALALQHAHERGVVHRDVKPANIMVLPSGQPKVMDFGIAKVEAAQLTAAGQFFGTPLYMSPEQALSRPVDGRTDIFSLGAVAYALLTGRQAFEGESVVKILGRVVYQDPVPPTRIDSALPAEVDYLAARALAKSPDHRYPQARLFAEDIEDLLHDAPPRHLADWTPPPPGLPPDAEPSLVAELGPAAFLATITVRPADRPSPSAGASPVERAGGVPPRTQALLAGLLLALAGLLWARLPSPPPPAPVAVAAPSPGPAPETEPAVPSVGREPARIVLDFRHPLEFGMLRVSVDGQELFAEHVRGDVIGNLLLFKLRSGVLTEILPVAPGRRQVRVQVSWEDVVRADEIGGRLDAAQTYRLEARLTRITKELTLRWTR